jgi:dihydrolipoamide dehydrogenase
MEKKYDYIVIGSGPAGHVSAITASRLGFKTAIIEKDTGMMGGVCLNEGCIPAKSLYAGAYLMGAAKSRPELMGISSSGDVMKELVLKSHIASETLKRGLLSEFKRLGVDVIEARAEFEDSSSVRIIPKVGRVSVIGADNILVATGSAPKAVPGISFDGNSVISSKEAINLDFVPKNILIVGAGPIGVEFASFFAALGCSVTLVEAAGDILPFEDRDVSSAMRNFMKKNEIKVYTSARINNLVNKGEKVSVTVFQEAGEGFEKEYDIAIISVGRSPLTSGLGLEKAGVKLDEKGFIPVDGAMLTNIPGIYAAGDVVPGPMLAHSAQAEGELAALAVAGKKVPAMDYSCVPNAVYARMQTASVGLTEKEALEKGLDIVIGKSFFKANGKAVAVGESDGFVKIIADTKTRFILGAHIAGYQATEMIHELILAKRANLKVDDIAFTVHAHPTFSESTSAAAKEILYKL